MYISSTVVKCKLACISFPFRKLEWRHKHAWDVVSVNNLRLLFVLLSSLLGPHADHIMLKFPSQCVVTAESVMWNKDMTDALQNGSLRGLSDLRHVRLFCLVPKLWKIIYDSTNTLRYID